MKTGPFLGLRTALYAVDDITTARAWYGKALELEPYFDQPFYVGFNVAGFELGLMPSEADLKPGRGGAVPYWGVASAVGQLERLVSLGATVVTPVQDVGEGIKTALLKDPFGNLLGIIENPHFPNTQ